MDDNENKDDANLDKVDKFRRWSLALAESFDAWRLSQRALVIAYCYLVARIISKFMSFGVIEKIQCDPAVLQTLLTNHIDLTHATNIACRAVDVLGPPTTYSAIVGAVLGIAAIVFGVYTNTGKDWSKSIIPWKWGESKTTNSVLNENDAPDDTK